MKKLILITLILVLFSVSVMGAGEIIDTQASANDRVGLGATADWLKAWTTFTASETYYVKNISTVMCKYTNNAFTGVFNINLYHVNASNLPDGHIMGSGNYDKSDISCQTTGTPNPATDWQNFTLNEAVQLNASQKYAIVFNITASGTDERIQWGFYNLENTHYVGYFIGGIFTQTYNDQATFRTYNTSAPTPPAPSSSMSFISPTPPSGSNNNTLVRFAWNTSTNRSDFYWRSQGGAFAKYLDNVTNNNATYSFTANVTTDGTYEYFASLPDDNSTNTTVYEWSYDTTEPPITINGNTSFSDTNITANLYDDTLILNIGVTDNIDLFAFHLNLTYSNGTVYHSYTNSSLSGTSFTYYKSIDVTDYPSGVYNVNILASDSHTANKIGDYKPKKITNGLDFDTEEGNRVMFWAEDTAVMNASKCEEDRYCFDVNFTDGQEKKRKFFVQSDASLYYKGDDSGYLGHFVISKDGITGNWLDVEGVNTTATVTRLNSSMYSIELAKIKDKVRFHSLGGLNVNEEHYLYTHGNLVTTSATLSPATPLEVLPLLSYCAGTEDLGNELYFDYVVYENNTARVNGTTTNTTNGTQVLAYNITNTYTISEGESWIVSCRANSMGQSASWLNSSVGVVSGFVLDNCTLGNYTAANFTFLEENNRTSMTADIVGNFNYSTGGVTKSYQVDLNSVSQFQICVFPDGINYSVDAYMQYEGAGDIKERYYLEDAIFNENTQVINLYNFLTNTGISEFKAVQLDRFFQPFTNIIAKLQRYYPEENAFITVQVDRTDEFGNTIFYSYQNEIDYRIVYESGGSVLDTTSPFKLQCDSATECEQTFIVQNTSTGSRYSGLNYNLTYNNASEVFTLSWYDTNNFVSSMTLKVQRIASNGFLNICDSTVSSSSGLINCNTSGYNGIITARVYSTASPITSQISKTIEKAVTGLADAIASSAGISSGSSSVVAFVMFAVIAGFGSFGFIPLILASMFGLIVIFIFKIVSALTLTMLVSGLCLGLVVAFVMARRSA